MFTQERTQGQAIILIAFAIIALVAITGLAIDGGNVFSDRRHAQSAADNAAQAAALLISQNNGGAPVTAAITIATNNGYTNGSGYTTVTVYTMDNPLALLPAYAGCGTALNVPNDLTQNNQPDLPKYYIVVTIKSAVKTYFAPVIGIPKLSYCAYAISHGVPGYKGIPFYGSAIVGLDPNQPDNSFDSGTAEAAKWYISGGGIFSNANAYSKNSNSVTFTEGACIASVGASSGFANCNVQQNRTDLFYNYPTDIIPLLPPTPACTGTATQTHSGQVYTVHPEPGFETVGNNWSGGLDSTFAPGVYCIKGLSGMTVIHNGIIGTGVTFYFDPSMIFTLKYDGNGYLGATAPTDPNNPYVGVLMFGGITTPPCTQNLEIRGQGSTGTTNPDGSITPITGTIFMPSACIDYRGNGEGYNTDSMMIGYKVSSNGTSNLYIKYDSELNWKPNVSPTVELTK